MVCYLCMKSIIRKNERLSTSVSGAVFGELFRHLEARPKSRQAERVERILDLLSRLGHGDTAAFFQKGDLLSRYEWRYGLTFSRGRGLSAELMFTKELPEEDAWEYRAVRFLMSLVPDRINRLRRCADEGCKKWFFAATREDQQYCGGNCRQRHYDSDPAKRAHKKKYMRELRALHERKLFREVQRKYKVKQRKTKITLTKTP
jgi:hypothetical protein